MSRFERLFVWVGGALFVLSLAVCGYMYLIVWGRRIEGPYGWRPVMIDMLLLGVFGLHHSVFAREGVKRWLTRFVPDRLMRSIYVWVASLLFLGVCLAWQPVGGGAYQVVGARALTHAALQLAGVWIIASAVRAIDPLELAGIRPPRDSESLQITGPFAWVRHPLYSGWLLATFGAAHMTGDRLAFAVLTAVYLIVAVPFEERSLGRAFGDRYNRYKQRVPWRMVPYVY